MSFNINRYSFCFNDSEYFNWFADKTEKNLKKIIQWKGLHRVKLYDNRKDFWNGKSIVLGNFNNKKIVTRAFLCHLNDPIEYPILDRFVWKAMRNLTGNGTNKHFYEWQRDYEKTYIPFFNGLYKEHQKSISYIKLKGINVKIIKRRILDRALWEYGRMLP
ncbi:MAG: hypothetical protein KAJ18_09200 [Candidatus Omnitrophica bacterium]|nr:hypothetical protein [Candidatus Omnitrophota bacterium]